MSQSADDKRPSQRLVSTGKLSREQLLAAPSHRIGRYAVLSELGRGGMGVVYRCHDPSLNRTVAIKMMHESKATSEGLARFQREALAVAKIQHPGIVTLLEAGMHEGCPYLVMDFVEGETFSDLLKREKTTACRIAEIVREVSLALHHAHAAGVIHRDVKPQNIMIDPQGRPLIMDFGLARETSATQQLTRTGQILGTPAYMAPEQADADMGAQGPWTDVYALGAVLYRALAGRVVFEATGPAGMLKKVLLDKPEPLGRIDPTIPPDLVTITLRCLEKEPHHRYPSATMLADDLELFLNDQGIQARPTGGLAKGIRGAQRNLVVPLSALAATLVAVGAVAAIAYMSDGHETARRNQEAKLEATGETNDKGPEKQADTTLTSRPQVTPSAPPTHAKEAGPTSAMDWYERGQDQFSDRNMAGAIDNFSRAIDIDPQLLSAWLARGNVHEINGNLRMATIDFSHAIEIDPSRAGSWLSRGKARAHHLQYEEALEDFSKAIEIDPSNWQAWENRARLRLKTGDRAGSEEDYAKAHSLSTDKLFRKAIQDTNVDDYNAAIAAFNKAFALDPSLEIDPDYAAAWVGRGIIRNSDGDHDGAIEDYSRAIEIDPALQEAWMNRGGVRKGKGDLDGAIEDFSRAIECNENFGLAWRNRGSARLANNDLKGAIEDYSRAIEIDPALQAAWCDRAYARAKTGDLDGALEDCTHAIEIDPGYGAAWMNRGGVRIDKGDLDGAIEDFSRAIKCNEDFGRAWRNRGSARLANDDLKGAIDDYTRVIMIDPDDAVAWRIRGDARQRTADINGAITDWQRFLELAPNDPWASTVRDKIQELHAQQAQAESSK